MYAGSFVGGTAKCGGQVPLDFGLPVWYDVQRARHSRVHDRRADRTKTNCPVFR